MVSDIIKQVQPTTIILPAQKNYLSVYKKDFMYGYYFGN